MINETISDNPVIRHEQEQIDLIAADITLAAIENTLVNVAVDREYILKDYLEWILLDCMPSLGMLTFNALVAANTVIIPVQASFLSAKGLEQLLATIGRIKKRLNPSLQISGILMTMVDSRTNNAKDVMDSIRQAYGHHLHIFDASIPRSVRAEESPATGKSILVYDPNGKVASSYIALAQEVTAWSERQRAAQNIQLASVDDLFGLSQSDYSDGKSVIELPVDDLHDFHSHPYKVIADDAMQELIESDRDYGVLTPLDVRSLESDGYEIVSGHRRKFAALQAGLANLPCIESKVDDDTAIQRMVDSNLYRPDILPSEKAFAYKMKLAAMKRQLGRPSKDNPSQVGTQKRSDQILAEQVGESRNQIQRYIRLTSLSSDLLNLVDAKKISLNMGVSVSYLDEIQQIWLFEFIRDAGYTPSLGQAEKLKKYHSVHKLTKGVMEVILADETGAGSTIAIKTRAIEKYFPPDTSKQEMEETTTIYTFDLLPNNMTW